METTPEVNYVPSSPDPEKACTKCQNFTPTTEGEGNCFGHKVLASGTCNFFTAKK